MVNSFLDLGHCWKNPQFSIGNTSNIIYGPAIPTIFLFTAVFWQVPSKNTAIAVALVAIITIQPRQKEPQKNMLFTCLVCQLPTYPLKRHIFHYNMAHQPLVDQPPGLCFKDFGRDAITQKSTQTVNLGPSLSAHLERVGESGCCWVGGFFVLGGWGWLGLRGRGPRGNVMFQRFSG